MTIHTTAPDRKTLVKALAEHLGEEAVYSGPPAFTYTVGRATVDRTGSVVLPEGMDPIGIQEFLVSKGWLEPEQDRLGISIPAEDLTVQVMRNLVLLLYSKQYLINRALGEETLHIDDSVVGRLEELVSVSPADFKARTLDFKAQGLISGIDFSDDRITMDYPLTEDPAVVSVYTQLTLRIIAAAKAATRVHPERQQPENEKYFMRSWLVRLGFGGAAGKNARRILLKNLKGHSAFRSDAEARKHRDKYAEIRRIRREVNAEGVRHDED